MVSKSTGLTSFAPVAEIAEGMVMVWRGDERRPSMISRPGGRGVDGAVLENLFVPPRPRLEWYMVGDEEVKR